MRGVAAELQKLASLTGVRIGAAAAVATPTVLSLLSLPALRGSIQGGHADARTVGALLDAGYTELMVGTVGVVVVCSVAASSEYTLAPESVGGGRPITMTLIATPRRLLVLLNKIAALVAATAALSVPAILAIAFAVRVLLGSELSSHWYLDMWSRYAGVSAYWILMGILSFSMALLLRNASLPIVLFMVNSSIFSVSAFLAKFYSWAMFLPDLAGIAMFMRAQDAILLVEPFVGALWLCGWTATTLAVSGWIFLHRDA